MLKGIVVGLIGLTIVGLATGYAVIKSGMIPANADAKPGRLERWAANTSLRASLEREAPRGPNPVAATPANLAAGLKLYAENCAVCHGAADAKRSNIAKGLYQEAPQLARDGVEDDPEGVTYWKVKHGIRLTGMPAFDRSLNDTQIWQITAFLKHMDKLPPNIETQWRHVPSATARMGELSHS